MYLTASINGEDAAQEVVSNDSNFVEFCGNMAHNLSRKGGTYFKYLIEAYSYDFAFKEFVDYMTSLGIEAQAKEKKDYET